MRAVRYHGRCDIRVDQIDEPVCGDGEVKIRPAFVGICGSDIGEYLGGPRTIPTTPHAVTGATLPVTLGHEFSGTIEAVGAGVASVKVGDRVAIKPNLYDGSCASCRVGRVNSCQNLGFVGFSSDAGGLSDHVVVKKEQTIRLPDSVSLEIAALVEPLSVAWHAVKRSLIKNASSETALVTGGGPIGLAVTQVLKALGMKTIVVAEVSHQRQTFARKLGATDVLNPKSDDVVARVRSMTDDAGADVAFECSGIQSALDACVAGIRTRGTVTVVSLWAEKLQIDGFDIVSYEKHVVGAVLYDDGDFEAVIEAISSGRLNPSAMITSKIRLEDVEEKGFKALIEGRDQHVKILVDIAA